MREIGSEFWLEREPAAVSQRDGCYVLSGRTAIDLIIQDIAKRRTVRKVYMPAWGCDSMLAPYSHRDIYVDFYDVRFDGQLKCHTDFTDSTDILYVTNYFGYENTLPIETIKEFKAKGAIILYDRTHSFLMENDPYLELADYSFASIRKWMGVIGGAVVKGVKDCQLKSYTHLDYKEQAMRMKKAFIEGDTSIDKQTFLSLYGEFGHHLVEDYRNYEMDDLSYALYKTEDFNAMRRKRRENAKYLHENLKGVRFMGEFTDKAVPLFVPVFFETTEQRNAIRKKLIEAQIYCPIHWPKPAQIPTDFAVNRIYNTELSLICDQRYDINDMKRIIETIQ
jgi:dTDP-4-amino-4,6-dideoxygalactose transaminase